MNYLNAKSDLNFIKNFSVSVSKLWSIEDIASKKVKGSYLFDDDYNFSIVKEASKDCYYQENRSIVAKSILRATKIANFYRIPIHLNSFPPPAVGGPVIPINLFEVILYDNSYGGVDKQMILDAINKTIGACDDRVRIEFFHLINPFFWLRELLVFVLRIPYVILSTTGFNVSKIEESIWGKLSKAIFLIIIFIVLLKLGFNKDELKEVLEIIK